MPSTARAPQARRAVPFCPSPLGQQGWEARGWAEQLGMGAGLRPALRQRSQEWHRVPAPASLPDRPGLGGRREPLATVAHLSVLVWWPQRCLSWGLSQRRGRFCCQSTKGPTLSKIKELTRRAVIAECPGVKNDPVLMRPGTAVTPAPTDPAHLHAAGPLWHRARGKLRSGCHCFPGALGAADGPRGWCCVPLRLAVPLPRKGR